jgi:hypothetical protein
MEEYFRTSAERDRKSTCSEFWEFLKIFVRDLYANQKIVDFGTFQAFSVSVTCVFSVQMAGSTPAASTILKILIFLHLPIRT